MALIRALSGSSGGGDITFTDGGTNGTTTVDADHKYAYVSVYRNGSITCTYDGTTLPPTYTESGTLSIFIIPNVKAGKVITVTLGIGRVVYID